MKYRVSPGGGRVGCGDILADAIFSLAAMWLSPIGTRPTNVSLDGTLTLCPTLPGRASKRTKLTILS